LSVSEWVVEAVPGGGAVISRRDTEGDAPVASFRDAKTAREVVAVLQAARKWRAARSDRARVDSVGLLLDAMERLDRAS
jgi:hypothetical protein